MGILFLYVLRLEHNRWWIDSTDDIENTYQLHKIGSGPEWTALYKPLAIHETRSNIKLYDVDRYVEEYMDLYGISNVRGGVYKSVVLESYLEQTINAKITRVRVAEPEKINVLTTDIDVEALESCESESEDLCQRCGFEGHTIIHCNAKISKDYKPLRW